MEENKTNEHYTTFKNFIERKANNITKSIISLYKMKELNQYNWAYLEKKEIIKELENLKEFIINY